jgi:protein MpaA
MGRADLANVGRLSQETPGRWRSSLRRPPQWRVFLLQQYPGLLTLLKSRSIGVPKGFKRMNRGCSISFICAAAVAALSLAGCYQPQPSPKIIGETRPLTVVPPLPEPKSPEAIVIGRSVKGRPITAHILGAGDDTVLIMAVIHGDEASGAPLVEKLADYLGDHPSLFENRRVILIPVANPDGMALNCRENTHGIDLNRNFEAGNRINNGTNGYHALTEPETVALKKLIQEYRPDRIVSIHQPLNCLDYDGPGNGLASRMAEGCRLPVRKLGARPGSLGSYTGETLGIPTVTMELPREASRLSQAGLWSQYGHALLTAVTYSQHVAK